MKKASELLARVPARWKGRADPPFPLFVKPGYQERHSPEYFQDDLSEHTDLVHQPDVYPFAAALARNYSCSYLIDIGCGRAHKLFRYADDFELIGLDIGPNIDYCRETHAAGTWISWDLERDADLPLSSEVLERSVVICSDVIEHLVDPRPLLKNLRSLNDRSLAVVLSTPERDLVHGPNHLGPPPNLSHVREWNTSELNRLLDSLAAAPSLLGLTRNNDRDSLKHTTLAVLDQLHPSNFLPAPASFTAVAIMTAFNEADIVAQSIKKLNAEGIRVHVIDNWSTDGTSDILRSLSEQNLCSKETFPPEGDPHRYEWHRLLQRVEQVANASRADWILHHDCDEIRKSPWDGVTLRDALYNVERAGFTAVDHTLIDFPPTNEAFKRGTDLEEHFKRFRFGWRPGHFVQVKAWKNTRGAKLADEGGHQVDFPGRRVFPYNFLLKHYPIRSQAHGQRKVFDERRSRYAPEDRARGWHIHYDEFEPGHSFIVDPGTLFPFDDPGFQSTYLVERLTRVGTNRGGQEQT